MSRLMVLGTIYVAMSLKDQNLDSFPAEMLTINYSVTVMYSTVCFPE